MELNEVKAILRNYYDFPKLIAEEEATVRAFSGLSDDQASREIVESCKQRISQYARNLSRCRAALEKLHPIDQRILELAYMGPRDPRKDWFRRPPWKEIAAAVGYCESTTRAHEHVALQFLSKALEPDTETLVSEPKIGG